MNINIKYFNRVSTSAIVGRDEAKTNLSIKPAGER